MGDARAAGCGCVRQGGHGWRSVLTYAYAPCHDLPMTTTFIRRAAVWRAGRGRWVSEKGNQYHEFKVLAVTQSPIDPDKDSEHTTWRKAMDDALAYVDGGERR